MKKLFLSLLLLLPLCGFAQKGMQGVGFGIEYGIGSDNMEPEHLLTSYGATFKYEYNWTDRVCFSANLNVMSIGDYKIYNPIIKENWSNNKKYEIIDGFTDKSLTAATFGLDIHFFLNGIRKCRPYLLLGASYAYSSMATDDYISDMEEGPNVIKLGLGFNWRLTYNSCLQIELPIRICGIPNFPLGHFDGIRYDADYYRYQGNVLSYCSGSYCLLQEFYYTGFCPSINYIYTF